MDNKRNITTVILSLLTSLFAIAGFISVWRAVFVDGASNFVVPTIWFSLFVITLGVSVLIVQRWRFLGGVLAMSFLASFVLAPSVWHALFVILAAVLVSFGIALMRREGQAFRQVHVGRVLRVGAPLFVLSLSIAVSSQYYSSIKELPREDLLPRIEETQPFQKLTDAIVERVVPQDLFSADGPSEAVAPEGAQEASPLKNLLGEHGSAFLESLSGKSKGVTEVITSNVAERSTDLVRERLRTTLIDENPLLTTFLPRILTAFVFLSAWSIGSLLKYLWMPLAHGVFLLLRLAGIVHVRKEQREVEVIQ